MMPYFAGTSAQLQPVIRTYRISLNTQITYFCRSFGTSNTGVDKKISAQVKNLSNQGINAIIYPVHADNTQKCTNRETRRVQIPIIGPLNGIVGKIKREYQVNLAFKDLISTLEAQDVVYLRIPYPSPNLSRILRQSRVCKVVIEYQTKNHLNIN